jgi:hypothetical protein|tara:strand:- start:1680 stop:1859 length:180 start_codon:yes stop_codon:yes gene_type:complete
VKQSLWDNKGYCFAAVAAFCSLAMNGQLRMAEQREVPNSLPDASRKIFREQVFEPMMTR